MLQQQPFSGHTFVFRGRRGDIVKLLWWDGLFKGLSENDLDHVLSSFSARQCLPSQGLIDVLSKHMAQASIGAEWIDREFHSTELRKAI